MKNVELTCIGCPLGCQIKVALENGKVIEVCGNTCKKGADYAKKEVTNPTRIITSTVLCDTKNNDTVQLSVKTESDVPKDKIFEVMKQLKGVRVKSPIKIGDVILYDVAGTNVNVIATKNIE